MMECESSLPFAVSCVLFALSLLVLSFCFMVVMKTIDDVWPKLFDLDREWVFAELKRWRAGGRLQPEGEKEG